MQSRSLRFTKEERKRYNWLQADLLYQEQMHMVDLRAVAKGEKAIAERRAEIEKMELDSVSRRKKK